MRKNAPRKWIHAILDLLPLLVIPIFALFTTNKNATFEQEVTVNQNEVVEFNQLFHNDLEYSYTRQDGAEVTLNDYIIFSYVPSENTYNFDLLEGSNYFVHYVPNHKYYLRLNVLEGTLTNNLFIFPNYLAFNEIHSISTDFYAALHFYADNLTEDFTLKFYFNVFDLTIMFGEGNEPTKEQFDIWYPNDNYAFNSGTRQLLKDVSTVTYNDTDIGSQFMYALYKPVHKYFNFNRLFNMQGIYDWLQLNLFGGNAPLPVTIVWNIIVYEFFVDLIFLLYSVFMFFIDFATNTLQKFLDRSR